MKKAGARGRMAGSAAAVAAGRQDWDCGAPADLPPASGLKLPSPWSLAAWGVLEAALSRAALARESLLSRSRTVAAVTSPWTRNTGRLAAAEGAGVAASLALPAASVSLPAVVTCGPDWLRNGMTRAATSRAAAAPQATGRRYQGVAGRRARRAGVPACPAAAGSAATAAARRSWRPG